MEKIRLYQLLVGLFFIVTASVYISCIPIYYDTMVTECIMNGCGNVVPPLILGKLTLSETALLLLLVDCSFTLVFYLAALILLWKGAKAPVGLLAALAMIAFGTSFPSLVSIGSADGQFSFYWFLIASAVGWIAISLFCLLFPNGSFVPAWSKYPMALIVVVNTANIFYEGNIWRELGLPRPIQFLWFILTTALLIYAQIHRFRRISSPEQRQQTKWVVYGVAVCFIGFMVISMMFDPVFYKDDAAAYVVLNAALHLSLSALPVTLTLAVLRRRLWDINPLVNRTIVYGAMTVFIILLYSAAVLYLGRLFTTWNHYVVSLLATALVAALFAPLKEWLQRQVNRLMKGRHDDPYAVLLELGSQMIQPLAPDAMLTAIARQVQGALRLPYVSIAKSVEGQETVLAEAGERKEGLELQALPIVYQGQSVGTLYAAARSAGEAFSSEDHKFLEVLLQQAGPIVNNADMLQAMRRLAEDLQESREKLVLAREEERRRIRNNLHDDLAPRLAALAINVAVARKFVDKEPAVAVAKMDELGQVIRTTVQDIRSLVNDLRPPALDELGLIGAIRSRMDEMAKPSGLTADGLAAARLQMQIDAPASLPPLSAAVEVAVYRIVTESMVNVLKHANASVCRVKLAVTEDNRLLAEVTDDGIGVGAAQRPAVIGNPGGIGLISMRERAAEIGGECVIEQQNAGGTRVRAWLPLSPHTLGG
ncbi:sensor histidine kinase [Paenibacillus nanensis]|uniref:histidine kinase n=1 Tax=Paenibacillus nanensis TaxID=393251 RepID=A0A3A1VL03_9BACL|nr:GAF domain-containing sensor histidine kinase [Paenibacillus nanensis]RIX60326.1 sensor histidine kinase [Paenibacillus nanensis]